jgi:hypothetical protein
VRLRVLRFVGRISYSIYLVHVCFILLAERWFSSKWAVFVVALGAKLAYSTVPGLLLRSHLYAERRERAQTNRWPYTGHRYPPITSTTRLRRLNSARRDRLTANRRFGGSVGDHLLSVGTPSIGSKSERVVTPNSLFRPESARPHLRIWGVVRFQMPLQFVATHRQGAL